jgi:hypothetical protein
MVRERRRHFRMRVSGQQPVVLKTASGISSAILVDQSACGFGLELAERPDLRVGMLGQLATAEACFTVRVARVDLTDSPYRVGVELVEDLPTTDDFKGIRPGWRSFFSPVTKATVKGMTWFGIVVASLLGVAIWTGSTLIVQSRFGLPEIPAQESRQKRGSAGKAQRRVTPVVDTRRPSPATAKDTQVTGSQSAASAVTEEFRPETVLGLTATIPAEYQKLTVAKAHFLEFISDPAVANELGLSQSQRDAIRQAVASLQQTLAEHLAASQQWNKACFEALQETHQQVLQVLDANQRRQLDLLWERAGNTLVP